MIKIMSNYTTSTTKLISKRGNNGMIQWRAGSNQEEIKKSCQDANCLFLTGGMFMNPINGKVTSKEHVTTFKGTIDKDPEYYDKHKNQLMRVDKCFAIYGTPMLSAYAIDLRFPERIGLDGLKLAIEQSPRNADRARGALVGNASTILDKNDMKTVDDTIRASVKHHILYDHAWSQNPWVLDYAVASCNHIGEVEKAIDMGASVASIVLPQNIINKYKGKKIGQHRFVQCPENTSDRINCINCGGRSGPLCDAQTRQDLVIMFRQHGNNSWERQKKSIVRNIAKNAEKVDTELEGKDKIKHKTTVRLTLEEFEKAIKKGDRQTIISIGQRAMKKVSKATAKKYKQFLGV